MHYEVLAVGRKVNLYLLCLVNGDLSLVFAALVSHRHKRVSILFFLLFQKPNANAVALDFVPLVYVLARPIVMVVDFVRLRLAILLRREAVINYLEHVIWVTRVQFAVTDVQRWNLHFYPVVSYELFHFLLVR